MSAPSPQLPRRREWLPSRRALWVAVAAFAIGLGAFLALWWDQRNSNDFYRTEPGLPSLVNGQVFEPLPAPLPASERDDVMAQDEDEVDDDRVPDDARTGGISAPMIEEPAPAPIPQPIARPEPSGPTSLPRPIQQPAPRYPRDAFRRGEHGTVLLRVHVGANGDPGAIDLVGSSGSRSLDRAAIEAVRRWRFAPAMRGESPVDGTVQVPIEFSLGR